MMLEARVIRNRRGLILWTLLLLAGCTVFHPAPPTTTLSGYDFARIFDNYDLYTCVWYMGSDTQYHHFCMEHWKLNEKATDGTMDKRDLYQVSVQEWNVPRPFALTDDENQWRLLRPKRPTTF